MAARSRLASFIVGAASGAVEAETRFQWFWSEWGREGREAETVLLKSLPLKGIKKLGQALGGGAPEPVCMPGVLEAARREQSREMQEGRRKGARQAVLPVSQHRQGLKEIATAYMIRITLGNTGEIAEHRGMSQTFPKGRLPSCLPTPTSPTHSRPGHTDRETQVCSPCSEPSVSHLGGKVHTR